MAIATAAPDLEDTMLAVLARAPGWVRRDLTANHPLIVARAEETFAAIIVAALADRHR